MVKLHTCVVLAGGVGSRLYPLTKIVPKPLVPFAGAPLIQYIVESLQNSGFKEVIITARYLGDQIVSYFKGKEGVKPLLLDSKDTADAVRLASDFLTGDFLVSMGDVVTNIPYRTLFEYHSRSGATATIVLKEVDNPLPYGIVYIDDNRDVVLFSEKPPSLEIYLLSIAHHRLRSPGFYSNLVNAGIYVFNDIVLKILARNTGLMDFGRHVFPYLLESGFVIKGWIAPSGTYWNDIGRVEIYKEALWDLLESRVKGWIPRGLQISRGLYTASDVEINGVIHPPVYLGKGVLVEQGSVIGPYAVLEDNVVVKKGARVSYSIIWHKTIISSEANVYDSVLMNNVHIREAVKVLSSIVGTGCIVNEDLYKAVVEPCIKVSPYEDLW